MTLVLESGILPAMGLQAFGTVEEAAAFLGGLAFAMSLTVTPGVLIMVTRAAFITVMLVWLDHRRTRRKRRHEVESTCIERLRKRMSEVCEVGADMLETRNLNPGHRTNALNHYRRRLKHYAHRSAMRGSGLNYFEDEPLGPREGNVIVWVGVRDAIALTAV